MMEKTNSNRTRIIGLRLTLSEYEQIEKKWKDSNCRKLSDYVRRILFEKPITTTYRNKSMDDVMTEMIKLTNDLNKVGNNFNQPVKKLHTSSQISEFKGWIMYFEKQEKDLVKRVENV